MERKISQRQVWTAVLRVAICLPPTLKLFIFLKRRYSSVQIDQLNEVCRLRGKRIILSESNLFLRRCLDNSVLPRDVYRKVKRVRPRFSASIGRAFVKNDISEAHEKLQHVSQRFRDALRMVGGFLSFTDWIRFNKLLGQNGAVLRDRLRAEHRRKLQWLKRQRFGIDELNVGSVFNFSHLELTSSQLEVLSRGPKFGIPPSSVGVEGVLSEFELYYQQVASSM